MNSIIFHHVLIISILLMVSNGAPVSNDNEATITNYDNTNDGKGNYHFRFETSNGITREETGTLVDVGLPSEHMNVKGSYSYINPEGELVTFNYTADENGYNILTPTPSPPFLPGSFASPISPAVLASLLGK